MSSHDIEATTSSRDEDVFDDDNYSGVDEITDVITKDADIEEDELVDKKMPKINLKHGIDVRYLFVHSLYPFWDGSHANPSIVQFWLLMEKHCKVGMTNVHNLQ